jgi:hypothetical protein
MEEQPLKPQTGLAAFEPGQSRVSVGPYARREIRFLQYWKHHKTTFKVYGITIGAKPCSAELVNAALRKATDHLRKNPTRHQQYWVGFISIHTGRGENQIIIDRWINENELLHQIFISSEKTPTRFRKPPCDHNSVCIWELYLQGFERNAWLGCVLQSKRRWPARLRHYLDQRLNARV